MIYLDHNATTPVHPEVLKAMMPFLISEWGNPSSTYKFGSKLKTVIETARARVAELIGAHATEVIFTSCATESNNAAIHAALKANPGKRHIVTSAVEHSSVLNYCMALEKEGYRVTYLPVDREGLLKIPDLENAITDETAIVSFALRAPAKGPVRRRIAAADDVHPEQLLGRRSKKIGLDIQAVLLGELLHPRQRAFDHFSNGRDFDPRVSAENRYRLLSLRDRD